MDGKLAVVVGLLIWFLFGALSVKILQHSVAMQTRFLRYARDAREKMIERNADELGWAASRFRYLVGPPSDGWLLNCTYVLLSIGGLISPFLLWCFWYEGRPKQ